VNRVVDVIEVQVVFEFRWERWVVPAREQHPFDRKDTSVDAFRPRGSCALGPNTHIDLVDVRALATDDTGAVGRVEDVVALNSFDKRPRSSKDGVVARDDVIPGSCQCV
jgi:hypothetical protein